MKNIKRKYFILIVHLVLGVILLNSCKENSTENEPLINYFVTIVKPKNNSEFIKSEKISFEAFLISDNDTIWADSINWFSDLTGTFGDFRTSTNYLKVGLHKISCNMFVESNVYTDHISLSVKNDAKVDTLLISENFEIFEIPKSIILALKADNNDALYIGTEDRGMYSKFGNTWKHYNVTDGLISSGIQCISVDKNNVIYTGHPFFDGMSKMNDDQWEIINMDPSLGWDVHCIIFDEFNKMWIATHYGEVLNFVNNEFISYPTLDVDFHHPNEIQFDQNGILWGASTYASVKYDGKSWDSVFVNNEKMRGLNLAIDNDNSVWFGSYNGLYKISDNDTVMFNPENSNLSSYTVWAVEVDSKNNIWVGTNSGLIKYDRSNWEIIQIPEVEKQIRFIEIDSKDNIWFANLSSFGVYKIK